MFRVKIDSKMAIGKGKGRVLGTVSDRDVVLGTQQLVLVLEATVLETSLVSECVNRVLGPTQHMTDHFGDD